MWPGSLRGQTQIVLLLLSTAVAQTWDSSRSEAKTGVCAAVRSSGEIDLVRKSHSRCLAVKLRRRPTGGRWVGSEMQKASVVLKEREKVIVAIAW